MTRRREIADLLATGAAVNDVARAFCVRVDRVQEIASTPLEPHLDPSHPLRVLGLDPRTAAVLLTPRITTRTELLAADLESVKGIGTKRLSRPRPIVERERLLT